MLNAFASDNKCHELLSSNFENSLSLKFHLSSEDVDQIHLLEQLKTQYRFMNRGFLTNKIPLKTEMAHFLRTKGFIWWGLRIFTVSTIDQAIEHADLETDLHQGGIYIINATNESDRLSGLSAEEYFKKSQKRSRFLDLNAKDTDIVVLPDSSDLYDSFFKSIGYGEIPKTVLENKLGTLAVLKDLAAKQKRASNVYRVFELPNDEVLKRKIKQQDYPVFENQRVYQAEWVNTQILEQRIDPKLLYWNTTDSKLGVFMDTPGWSMPKLRGVVIFSENSNKSLQIKFRNLTRRFGWKVKFNSDFTQALNQIRDQYRYVDGQWVQNSRYLLDQSIYKAMKDSFSQGYAYSAETWQTNLTGKDEMVAGIIGVRYGSFFFTDSTFYPENSVYTMDAAKYAQFALQERMSESGIQFIDMGRLSKFTKSLHGRLVTSDEFEKMIESLPKNVSVDLQTDWIPKDTFKK